MPRPVYSPRDPVLNILGESIVTHPHVYSLKSGFDDMLDLLSEYPYARFYCHVKWKESSGGHEFLIITEGGKSYIMDPQQGTVDKFLETHPYIKDLKWEDSYLARMDNAEFNETVLRDFNTEKSIVPWDAKLDIPYMLEHGLMSKEEAEQYWKEHPDEASNDRHFLTFEELDKYGETKNKKTVELTKPATVFTTGDFAKYGEGVDIADARGPITEAWNDIKNGVNPYSKKLWFHVSRSDKHEGKVFEPRVPKYLDDTKFEKDDPYYEDTKIPRVCFSPSIEGAIHAITSQGDRIGTGGEEMYVYIPEKPIEEYKRITNKEIVDKKLVFDAKYTKECWITEPVKLILYGSIMIDQVYNHRTKPTANKQAEVGIVSYKWHWQTKPQVIKNTGHEVFAWNDDKEKQHQKNNKQNGKPIKEEFVMDKFERDPSILKLIMESEDDSGNLNLDMIDTDGDGVGDAIGIGVDTSNEQNQYDPKEVETLNHLISAEAEAISDYFDAAKNTKVPVLSKVYSDIGEEERFHIEQLLYSKSTLTGEKYEPRDPKVRKEYEELLALGMDEETAMTTAVDKLSIATTIETDDDDNDAKHDIDEMTEDEEIDFEESFNMIHNMTRFISLSYDVILEAVVDRSDITESLFNEYTNFVDEMVIMEEVDNLNQNETKKDLPKSNPVKAVWHAFRSVYKIAIGLVRKGKLAFTKVRLKDKRRWAWIKKHGIKGLFGEGASLYFYSDKRNRYEVGQALTFLQMINVMNEKIIKDCRININTAKYDVEGFIKKLSNVEKSPIDSANMINKVKSSTLDEGIKNLRGMVLTKSKLLVNENNEAYLEELFFGYTDEKYQMISEDEEGNKTKVDLSMNIYNQLDIVLSALETVGNETNVVIEELDKLEGQGGVYSNNPKLYKLCVSAAAQMTKSIEKFIGAVSHDISECFKINRGLKEAVDAVDETMNPKNKEERAAAKEARQNLTDLRQGRAEEVAKQQQAIQKQRDAENRTKFKTR